MCLFRLYKIDDKRSGVTFRARSIEVGSCFGGLICVNFLLLYWAWHRIWEAFKKKKVLNIVRGLLLFRNSVAEIYDWSVVLFFLSISWKVWTCLNFSINGTQFSICWKCQISYYITELASIKCIPVETRRRFNAYKTSIRRRRRRIHVL